MAVPSWYNTIMGTFHTQLHTPPSDRAERLFSLGFFNPEELAQIRGFEEETTERHARMNWRDPCRLCAQLEAAQSPAPSSLLPFRDEALNDPTLTETLRNAEWSASYAFTHTTPAQREALEHWLRWALSKFHEMQGAESIRLMRESLAEEAARPKKRLRAEPELSLASFFGGASA